MKKMKKIFAMFMTLMIALSMSITVFAEESTSRNATVAGGSITITNALKEETYHLYKVLDLSYDNKNGAYSYTLPAGSPWEEFFTGVGGTWFTYDASTRLVTSTLTDDNPGKYDMAKAMMKYASEKKVPAEQTKVPETAGVLLFENLEQGYYLIDTSAASVCILRSNISNLEVTEKNPTPRLDKQVAEEDLQGALNWGTMNTVNTLDEVYYRLTVSNLARLNNVVIHDHMDEGLIFQNDVVITKVTRAVSSAEVPSILVEGTHYTVETNPTCTHGCDFHITFDKDNFLQTITNSDSFIIEYSAVLGTKDDVSKVVVGSEGNKNTAFLTYGDNQKTPDKDVETYTWPVELFKYWVNPNTSDAKDVLKGAQFELHTNYTSGVDSFVTSVDENGFINGWAHKMSDGTIQPEGAVPYRFTSDANGKVTAKGLDSNSYKWIEIVAPEGFNLLTTPAYFTISADGKLRDSDGTQVDRIEVENKTGNALPETGSTGTMLFIVIGMAGVVIFGVLMVTNKRMKKEGF